MKVLSFDIATVTGWAFVSSDLGIEDGGHFSCKDIVFAHDKFVDLVELWKPDVVISASPVRYHDVIVKLSRIYGVLMYVCAIRGIKMYYEKGRLVNDATMKKSVLGNGHAKKPEIMARYNTTDEDYADACLFGEYALLKLKG